MPEKISGGEAWWLLPIILIAGVAMVITLVAPYPPFQDIGETVYQSYFLHRWFGGDGLPSALCAQLRPVPNSVAQGLLAAGMSVLSPVGSARLFELGYLALASWLCVRFGRRSGSSASAALASLAFLMVFVGTPFWNGYVNYLLGLLVIVGWLGLDEKNQGSIRWFIALSGLIFFCHALAMTAFCICALPVVWRRHGTLRTGLAMTPLLALTSAYLLLPGFSGSWPTPDFQWLKHIAYKFYSVFKLGPYRNFVFAEGGDAVVNPSLYYAGIATNLAVGTALAAGLALGLHTAWRAKAVTWTTALSAGGLLVLFVALPSTALAIVNPGERFLLPLLLLCLRYWPPPVAWTRTLVCISAAGWLISAAQLYGRDFATQVPFDQMVIREHLFWVRPTDSSDRPALMLAAERDGTLPTAGLRFETGLFFNARPPYGCDLPGHYMP